MKLIIATHNEKKLAELQRILVPLGIEAVTDRDLGTVLPEVEETGTTFAENARLKAESACRATGLAAVADDSGLSVDALGGRPGVYSARYGGPSASTAEKNTRLLGEMAGVPDAERTARYHCAICCVFPDGQLPIEVEATFEVTVAHEPRGTHGFGYDPIVCVAAGLPGAGKSVAELTEEEKDAVSHRGVALRRFRTALKDRMKNV